MSELRREAIHFKRLTTLLIARIRQSLVRLDPTVRHQTERQRRDDLVKHYAHA